MNQREPQTGETKSLSIFLTDMMRVRSVTLEKLAQATGISERYIRLILDEKFEKLPAAPYVHGYLLKIAHALNIDGEELWQGYLKYSDSVRRSGEKDKLPENRFVSLQVNKKLLLAGALVLIIVIYIAFRIPSFLGKPSLAVSFENNLIVAEPAFVLAGTADPKNELTINNEIFYPDTNGKFEKVVELSPGFNTFVFKAKKLLGKEETVVRQIYYKAPTSTAISEPQTQ